MPLTAITTDFNKSFYIKINFFTKCTFYFVPLVDNLTYAVDLLIAQVFDSGIGIYAAGSQDLFARVSAYAVDVLQRDFYSFFFWYVYTGYTCHAITPALSLALLVFGILTNDPHYTTAPDNFAFIASTFN